MKNYRIEDPSLEVRRSQLITPYGIGALADVNNQSVMIMGLKYWNNNNNKFHDIRLERAMRATSFTEPPVEKEGYVEVKRFPNWFFSPKTKKLKTFEQWEHNLKGKSSTFNKRPYEELYHSEKIDLVPVRFMCACRNGHVQDFPWFEWAHKNGAGSSMHFDNEKHELSLFSSTSSDSISSMYVQCTCGSKESLKGIFDTDGYFAKTLEKIDVKCHGKFVWDQDEDNNETINECDQPIQTVLRNATNFYFPNIVSSVNIPFSENNDIEKIKNVPSYLALKEYASGKDNLSITSENLKKDDFFRVSVDLICKNTKLGKDQVVNAIIEDRNQTKNSENITVEDYRYDEYKVLMGEKKFDHNSGRLNIANCDFKGQDFNGFEKKFNKLTLVNQLEVVNVLKSYSRIEPTDSDRMLELQKEEEPNSSHEVAEISLRNNDENSYLGLRALGEGIFVSLDNKEISDWKNKLLGSKIKEKIDRKMENIHEEEAKYISPVFFMLHTLAHVLIRELNAYCGYSSSALKERIYFSEKTGKEMYGFLIYTSSSDSEGTLGGLVKQCLPQRFFKILNSAIEKAKWCSYDPVCLETDSQGRDSLNAAACHACTLISETSCDKMNSFLDRTVLIGSSEEPDLGYFD